MRFRGFDVREVDRFLEQVATDIEQLRGENRRLRRETRRLAGECRAQRNREATFQQAVMNCEQVAHQVRENAERSAELIVNEAEIKAERMLNRAHARLSQLHEDISELRRQRKQIEGHIETIIEAHSRMLAMGTPEMKALDTQDARLKLLQLKR